MFSAVCCGLCVIVGIVIGIVVVIIVVIVIVIVIVVVVPVSEWPHAVKTKPETAMRSPMCLCHDRRTGLQERMPVSNVPRATNKRTT